MEPEGSSPYSQVPAICPYPEPTPFNLSLSHSHTHIYIYIYIYIRNLGYVEVLTIHHYFTYHIRQG